MLPSKLTFTHLAVLLLGLMMVTAAPAQKDEYQYKVAKRADVVQRASRTRPHYRRASPLPGQAMYAVFANTYFGGTYTATNSNTQQASLDDCARLCTATSDCGYFRYQTNSACALRINRPDSSSRYSQSGTRSALRGLTCADAKAQYPDIATFTCSDENY